METGLGHHSVPNFYPHMYDYMYRIVCLIQINTLYKSWKKVLLYLDGTMYY